MTLTRQQSFLASEYPLSLKLSRAAFVSFHFSSKSSTSFSSVFEDSGSNIGMTSSARRLTRWTRTWICGRSSHFTWKHKENGFHVWKSQDRTFLNSTNSTDTLHCKCVCTGLASIHKIFINDNEKAKIAELEQYKLLWIPTSCSGNYEHTTCNRG